MAEARKTGAGGGSHSKRQAMRIVTISMSEPWGRLTRQEVYNTLLHGTFQGNLRNWNELAVAIRQLSLENLEHVRRAAEAKEEKSATRKRKATTIRMANLRAV